MIIRMSLWMPARRDVDMQVCICIYARMRIDMRVGMHMDIRIDEHGDRRVDKPVP